MVRRLSHESDDFPITLFSILMWESIQTSESRLASLPANNYNQAFYQPEMKPPRHILVYSPQLNIEVVRCQAQTVGEQLEKKGSQAKRDACSERFYKTRACF